MLSLCTLLLAWPKGALDPGRLECEYRVNPIGIAGAKPRFSWIVTSNARDERQTAYEVRVARSAEELRDGSRIAWDSGRVTSDATVGIAYGGATVPPGERLYWNVTVWDANGLESPPSAPAYWEWGPDKAAWQAQWISKSDIACPYFRKEFIVKGRVVRARLYATAKGLYRLSINGNAVGAGQLTPGWTEFPKRIAYQTYDVTSMLRAGKAAIGMRLGPGWFSGHVAWRDQVYGPNPSGMAMLDIVYADGTTERVDTDSSWKASGGPVLSSDLLMGETCDARRAMPGWDRPGFDDDAWTGADAAPDGTEALDAQKGPMVEKLEELKVRKVSEPTPGVYVCDLGQNMVGWAKLKVDGPAGTQVTLRFAEVLNKDGTIYTANLRKAKATDVYTLRGDGPETYEPSFTFHGFRYVEVSGYPGAFNATDITGEVVGSNVPRTGTFACSSDMVNRLEHNIEWGMRGNYVDIPTDCPQRDERLGWMGDAETFAPTAAFISDIDGFMTKWTQDVDDAQTADGAFTDVSPNILGPEGAPAWGDAGVIVPWNVYTAYGDRRLLARNYPFMKAWVDRIDRYNPGHLWLSHRGNDYGDWLNVQDETPKDLIATAFFENSASLVAASAKALGNDVDAQKYGELADAIKTAFLAKYLVTTGPSPKLEGDTQTAYVLALAFGITGVDAGSLASPFGDRLAYLITVERHDHLSTGFVGVGRLMQALSMTGHADVAYKLLLQTTYPSWLYPITQGATTIWERWDGYRAGKGFQDPGMNSFNHYAMGAVGDWLYTSVAGIGIDPSHPGYANTILAPEFGDGLTWAKATLRSVRGDIVSAWHRSGRRVTWDVTVPANATATVVLPANARLVSSDAPTGLPRLGSGTYRFVLELS